MTDEEFAKMKAELWIEIAKVVSQKLGSRGVVCNRADEVAEEFDKRYRRILVDPKKKEPPPIGFVNHILPGQI